VGRIGCDIYGKVTAVPWAVIAGGVPRHPVQLYSALAGYLIFFVLWKKKEYRRYRGEVLLLFLILYSIYRFLVEFFRSTNGFTLAQYASLLAAAGLVLFSCVGQKSWTSEGGSN
jgi:phosphatidylglycerol:prolipoprotein diacylglycerol transferase